MAEAWFLLETATIAVGVDHDLSLRVYSGAADPTWRSLPSSPPTAEVVAAGDSEPVRVPLGRATNRETEGWRDDEGHRGYRARLSLDDVDVVLELLYGLDDEGELLVQVEQVGGAAACVRITGLYDWHLAPSPDAYAVVPRGSGYVIRSDQSDAVEVDGLFGTQHSMPLFGLVNGSHGQYQIVDTWWDAGLRVDHTPAEGTVARLTWESSLGSLGYARRLRIRFGRDLDHVDMAKGYRRYLIERGQFTTLRERAERLPALARYLGGIEYRWVHWPDDDRGIEQLQANVRVFQAAGLPVSVFYPKWPSQGVGGSTSYDAGWQGYLHPAPMPGGWPAAVRLLDAIHDLGCTAKVMVNPHVFLQDAPGWDPAKRSGIENMPRLSDHHAEWMMGAVLDAIAGHGFHVDALYFDGSSAYTGHHEHQGRSRRQGFEAQVAQFDEVRRRGILPGAELARSWAIPACDFFFFTDWSSDRLRHGEPVPVFPLVFHDAYAAHFSGGGYYDEGRYDWYEDRTPRLYELMYGAVPSHNWLPGGSRDIAPEDWGSERMNRRLTWLRRWHAYYQAVGFHEMVDHRFLDDERSLQRVEFANGVRADFDLSANRFRVEGVEGFTGNWEHPDVVDR